MKVREIKSSELKDFLICKLNIDPGTYPKEDFTRHGWKRVERGVTAILSFLRWQKKLYVMEWDDRFEDVSYPRDRDGDEKRLLTVPRLGHGYGYITPSKYPIVEVFSFRHDKRVSVMNDAELAEMYCMYATVTAGIEEGTKGVVGQFDETTKSIVQNSLKDLKHLPAGIKPLEYTYRHPEPVVRKDNLDSNLKKLRKEVNKLGKPVVDRRVEAPPAKLPTFFTDEGVAELFKEHGHVKTLRKSQWKSHWRGDESFEEDPICDLSVDYWDKSPGDEFSSFMMTRLVPGKGGIFAAAYLYGSPAHANKDNRVGEVRLPIHNSEIPESVEDFNDLVDFAFKMMCAAAERYWKKQGGGPLEMSDCAVKDRKLTKIFTSREVMSMTDLPEYPEDPELDFSEGDDFDSFYAETCLNSPVNGTTIVDVRLLSNARPCGTMRLEFDNRHLLGAGDVYEQIQKMACAAAQKVWLGRKRGGTNSFAEDLANEVVEWASSRSLEFDGASVSGNSVDFVGVTARVTIGLHKDNKLVCRRDFDVSFQDVDEYWSKFHDSSVIYKAMMDVAKRLSVPVWMRGEKYFPLPEKDHIWSDVSVTWENNLDKSYGSIRPEFITKGTRHGKAFANLRLYRNDDLIGSVSGRLLPEELSMVEGEYVLTVDAEMELRRIIKETQEDTQYPSLSRNVFDHIEDRVGTEYDEVHIEPVLDEQELRLKFTFCRDGAAFKFRSSRYPFKRFGTMTGHQVDVELDKLKRLMFSVRLKKVVIEKGNT